MSILAAAAMRAASSRGMQQGASRSYATKPTNEKVMGVGVRIFMVAAGLIGLGGSLFILQGSRKTLRNRQMVHAYVREQGCGSCHGCDKSEKREEDATAAVREVKVRLGLHAGAAAAAATVLGAAAFKKPRLLPWAWAAYYGFNILSLSDALTPKKAKT